MKISDKIQEEIDKYEAIPSGCMNKIEHLATCLGLQKAKVVAMRNEIEEELDKESNSTPKLRFGEWVSVHDELPANEQLVIGWARRANVPHEKFDVEICSIFADRNELGYGEFWAIATYEEDGGYGDIDAEVTHWMPLPEPPNSSKNSNS